ncbi:hypothetical protein LJG64_32015 [Pseudomonas aeruginosa]|nr:hypothetical protein [Pseudomonas aeruginosa]
MRVKGRERGGADRKTALGGEKQRNVFGEDTSGRYTDPEGGIDLRNGLVEAVSERHLRGSTIEGV